MTDLLEKAVMAARELPPHRQDDIARAVLMMAGDEDGPIALQDDERDAIRRSKAAAIRGEFATDADVRAVWAKYGL